MTLNNKDLEVINNFLKDSQNEIVISNNESDVKKYKKEARISDDCSKEVFNSTDEKKIESKECDNNVVKYSQHKEEQGKLTVNKTLDSNLLGKWKNDERDLEYEFKDNSVAILKNKNITFKLKYSTQDGEITLLQNAGSRARESKMSYSIDGDVVTIEDIKFKKVN